MNILEHWETQAEWHRQMAGAYLDKGAEHLDKARAFEDQAARVRIAVEKFAEEGIA